MERNSLEEQLGRKLSQRRLIPSENAWERINLERKKKPAAKKRGWWYFSVAAAMLAAALGLLQFIGTETQAVQQTVTTTEKTIAPTPQTSIAVEQTSESKTETVPTKPKARKAASEIVSSPSPVIIAQQSIQPATIGIEQQKIAEITASVLLLADSGKQISEDDVDALIQKARQDIKLGKGTLPPTDAAALLQSSESELDAHFRNGVFQNLLKHKRIRLAFDNHLE